MNLKWIFYLLILLALFSCTKKPTDESYGFPPLPKFAIDKYPSWSPDGKTIVYYHRQEDIADSSDTAGLYFINPDGTNKKVFLPGTGFVTSSTWSPDSKKLIFSYNYDLFKIDIATKEKTQLTFDGAWNLFPDWSPDGEWIAYDSELGTNGPSYIWIMDPAGNNKKDISVHGTGEWRMPSWSADGEQIVYVRSVIGVLFPEIFTMDKNGKNSIRLTINNRDDRCPDWSPVGGKIAWTSIKPGEPSQIWVMDEDGGNKKQLTIKGGDFPCFSPDGQKIVYVGGDEMVDNPLLWVMDADGGNKYQLTFKKTRSK